MAYEILNSFAFDDGNVINHKSVNTFLGIFLSKVLIIALLVLTEISSSKKFKPTLNAQMPHHFITGDFGHFFVYVLIIKVFFTKLKVINDALLENEAWNQAFI